MFGFFKKKREPSAEDFYHCAKDIIDLALLKNDAELAIESLATIPFIIEYLTKEYGLKIGPHSIFAKYLMALQEEELLIIAEMTRSMADTLTRADSTMLKRALILSWFESGEHSPLGEN